jgi:hypothetical protein
MLNPSGWQRSRAGGRDYEVLFDLASRDADRSQQITVRRPQWNSAREGDKAAVRMFKAVRLGAGLAYVPYRLRFSPNRIEVRAFLSATSEDPSQALSILEKAFMCPAESRTATLTAIPMVFAFALAPAINVSACSEVSCMILFALRTYRRKRSHIDAYES